ncbi:ABC transporter ATP-binding protein [Nocardia sp. 348MFTsu5.1]|uniref:ABC transporter ATP-binding protein n=1 Tax=Nocardia sp. 348MFTsu5.1 TaxID=1172185 RepID=UPI001E62D400|nr:ATP-binding cassette domain-containing protein [Nocardia sp. 348MFTsu5.1]
MAVSVDGITKRYRKRTAVDTVSFTVPTGSVTGLIGPNGAGKTTVMAILLGLVKPSSGDATILGAPIRQRGHYLPKVGALIESPAFHPAVSGRDNLRSLAALSGHNGDDIDGLLDLVGLGDRGGDRFGSYSLGMKQRLGIAAALLGDPELVILDEPTNGLDPQGMQEVRDLIGRISEQGRTVIVSSHLLAELEQVCDWLVVLDHGGLVHVGTPESLGATADSLVLASESESDLDDLEVIARATGLETDRSGGHVTITLTDAVEARRLAADLNRRAHTAGIVLAELHHRRADLEARYLGLINSSAL